MPFVIADAGGLQRPRRQILPLGHFAVVNGDFGAHPWLKAVGYFLATMMLLMGVQSMYQKFYSAKSGTDAQPLPVDIGTISSRLSSWS